MNDLRKVVQEEIQKFLKEKERQETGVSDSDRRALDTIRLFLHRNYEEATRNGDEVVAYESGVPWEEERYKIVIEPSGLDSYTYTFDVQESDERFAQDAYARMQDEDGLPYIKLPRRFR